MLEFMSAWASARSVAWRQAMSNHVGNVRVHRVGEVGDTGPALETFECFALCSQCGYLAEEGEGDCPGCGEHHWVDLQSKPAAEMLHVVESHARHQIPPSFRTAGIGGAVVLGGVAALLGWWLGGSGGRDNAVEFALLLGILAGAAAYLVLPRTLVELAFRRRPVRPIRWRLPQPLPDPGAPSSEVAQGMLEAEDELITAPVSGRPCVGYEVSVLFDAAGDRRPPMWVLEEEKTIACRVGGHPLPADGATLWLEAEPVRFREKGDGEQALSKFLRQRGLFASDGEYALFEAILEPGAAYRVVQPVRPAGAVPALARVEGDTVASSGRVRLGPRDEVALAFRRKHRLGQLVSFLLLMAVGVAMYFYIRHEVPPDTTFDEELTELQRCDLRQDYAQTRRCEVALVRALRRLRKDPAKCARVQAELRKTGNWGRQNRLLNLLLRYRRARFPEDVQTPTAELAPDPCVIEPTVAMVTKWHTKKGTRELVPGVARYNNRLLARLRNVVVKTEVLARVKLPREHALRLASHLLFQYRKLMGGAAGPTKEALQQLFLKRFHDRWKALGSPEPRE